MMDTLGAAGAAEGGLGGVDRARDYPTLFTGERYVKFRAASRAAARRAGAVVVEMEDVFESWDSDAVFVGHERMHLSPAVHRTMAHATIRALGPPPAVAP